MHYSSSVFAAAGLITSVSAHGLISSPEPRMPGAAMGAACGAQVLSNQASDHYGNIQGELQVAASKTDYNAAECNIWLCKGYKFADQTANKTQSYAAGQVVPITFDLRAPHAGVANVSVVNTATNTVIGESLISWADFANNAYTTPANETSFSITIPSGLESTCATAGDCVIQHYWNAASIDQTYESCIDFVIGSGSSSAAAPSVVSSSVAVASTSAAAAVSSTSLAAVTSAAPVTSSSATPTTLQTIVKSSSAAAVVASSTPDAAPDATSAAAEDEDDC